MMACNTQGIAGPFRRISALIFFLGNGRVIRLSVCLYICMERTRYFQGESCCLLFPSPPPPSFSRNIVSEINLSRRWLIFSCVLSFCHGNGTYVLRRIYSFELAFGPSDGLTLLCAMFTAPLSVPVTLRSVMLNARLSVMNRTVFCDEPHCFLCR